MAECSVEELQQLAQQYPSFAPAQFLLLKKLKEESHPDYAQQLQKAALYHHDPVSFDFLMNEQEYFTEFPDHVAEKQDAGMVEPIASVVANERILPDETIEQTGTYEAAKSEMSVAEEGKESETFASIMDIIENIQGDVVADGGVDGHFTEDTGYAAPGTNMLNALAGVDVTSGQDVREDELPAVVDEHFTENGGYVAPVSNMPTPLPGIENLMSRQEEAVTDHTAYLFEPYHTVDYFASQGIKLSQEDTKDSFGAQLRSFTEWLKTMKRLPATEQLKALDPFSEKKVENTAVHSVNNAEILTETMAEVWLKQGKLEKAAEVYHKLSLQNPSKRAYFAAKLESIKKVII